MDLTKIVYEYEINEEPYIMTFDMRSIAMFKSLTDASFLQSSAGIGSLDDATIIYFLASTLRKGDVPTHPLGEELFEFDVLKLLYAFHNDVVNMVVDAIPKDDDVKKKPQAKKVLMI